MSKDIINVYWAPAFRSDTNDQDWSMLYPEPTNLYDSLKKIINKKNDIQNSFFVCPATKPFFKKTYIFTNPSRFEYSFDFTDEKNVVNPVSKNYLNFIVERDSNIETGPLIRPLLSYIFFADQGLPATFTAPYFSKTEYTRYGSVIPGEFDIGQWFRPYVLEMQMWSQSGSLVLEENDPLFYVRFNTDKNIVLHKFEMNKKLWAYVDHCVSDRFIFGPGRSLAKRYNTFKSSRMNDAILNEIKRNVVGTHSE